MVTTRRSGANAAPIPYVPLRPSKRRKVTVTNTSDQPRVPGSIQPPSRTTPTHTVGTGQIRPSSEQNGLAPNSSSHGREPCGSAGVTVHPPNQVEAKLSTEQILAALKKLTTPGTSQNPIVLLEDSPSKGTQEALQGPSKVEPHMSQDRHNKLYSYITPRPALTPRAANGTTFTGHPGHDMFRMRAAKMATTGWHVSAPQQDRQDIPFAARHLASQPGGAQYAPARIPYFPHPPPAYPHHVIPMHLNEEYLRSKALQYVRECSRSSPWKRKMAEDPDETSESDSTEDDLAVEPSLRKSLFESAGDKHVRFKNGPVNILPDPHFQLMPLIEQASLLTSLLRVYPRSIDQKGLREDIAMLASVQNQHLADWLNFEVGQSRKIRSPHTPRVSRSLVASPSKPVPRPPSVAEVAEAERRSKQDDKVRGLLSADARVWQDGSGLSVADVYSDGKASTPERECGGRFEYPEVSNVLVVPEVFVPAASVTSLTSKNEKRTASPPVQSRNSGRLVSLLPKVERVASSPAVRTSGRKRVTPVRFRTE
jgi:hypothetical protein